MTAQLYNLGPDAIGESGTKGGPGFTLSRPEWIALQTCCANMAALPTTPDAFRDSLGDGAPSGRSDFAGLIEAFEVIGAHVAGWTRAGYPAVVALSRDACQYAASMVPGYYPQLLSEAMALGGDPGDGRARTALKAILGHLRSDTEERSRRAGEVAEQVTAFAAEIETDRARMLGVDGDAGLVRCYADRFHPASGDGAELTDDLTVDDQVLRDANAEYDRDAVVATTRPTYIWVCQIGAVAAAVVAGVYGRRPIEALERACAAGAKIATLPARPAADARLMNALRGVETSLESIGRDITECLPVIQRMRGVWGGIAADLAALASMVDDDAAGVASIIADLDVDAAMRAWAGVADGATTFRVNAYVDWEPGAALTAWKARTQPASSTARATRMAAPPVVFTSGTCTPRGSAGALVGGAPVRQVVTWALSGG